MSEQKMTYHERRQKIAESLTRYVYEAQLDEVIAMQAEAIREFVHNTYYAPDTIEVKKFTDRYLLEHGYIEPKTEEDGI